MAGPVGHIFTALMMLQTGNLVVQDEPAFIVGNCFPDIRYLGVVERKSTHEKNVRWEQIAHEPDPFRNGMLLHSLLDEKREAYMVAHKAYDHIPNTRFKSQMLKLIEDIILYDYVDLYRPWPTVVSYFNTIYPQEEGYSIKKEDIQKWHLIIQTFCQDTPSAATISLLLPHLLGENWVTVSIISAASRHFSMIPLMLIENIKNNPELKRIILEFYLNVPNYLIQD